MNPPTGPELRDIHLPPAPGWWPPAPGWWVLAALVLVCIFLALYKFLKVQKRRARTRELMSELDEHIRAAGADPIDIAASLSQFLRRMALLDTPAAAALLDERWLAYLDSRMGGEEFARGIGRVLLDAPYRADGAFDAPALIALVRRWTRQVLDGGAQHA
jgi:Domain of unknown function (DUF4381)